MREVAQFLVQQRSNPSSGEIFGKSLNSSLEKSSNSSLNESSNPSLNASSEPNIYSNEELYRIIISGEEKELGTLDKIVTKGKGIS